MELSATIQAIRGWEGTFLTLGMKDHPSVVGNQTGENDSSFRDSSCPPLKGGSIHFHHHKPKCQCSSSGCLQLFAFLYKCTALGMWVWLAEASNSNVTDGLYVAAHWCSTPYALQEYVFKVVTLDLVTFSRWLLHFHPHTFS